MSFDDTDFDDAPNYQAKGNGGQGGGNNNWNGDRSSQQEGKPSYGGGSHYSSDRPAQAQGQRYEQNNYQRNSNPPERPPQQQQGGQQGGYQTRQPYNNGGQQGGQRPPYNGGGQGQGGGNGFKGGFKQGGGGGGQGGFPKREINMNPELYLPYAAFGNENPPQQVVDQIQKVARRLEALGYVMRCGGMRGCEDIWEKACQKQEIHLPFRDFDQKQSKFSFAMPEAKILAGKFQPGFDGLKPGIQTFLAKNVRVLQGKDLKSPALFMITWTEDGAESNRERNARTGNSGHAIAVADAMRIPVYNLGRQGSYDRLHDFISHLESKANEANSQ